MGNAQIAPAPNQVDILQSGGCSGGGSCGFTAPQFYNTTMDARLTPYLTQTEYSDVLLNANNLLKRRAPTCKAILFTIPTMLLGMILFTVGMTNPPNYKCLAANGICHEGQDTVADSCCLVTCCRKSGRRLDDELEDLDNPGEVSKQWSQGQRLEESLLNVTSAHTNGDSVQTHVGYAKRALLSRRMSHSRQLVGRCETWTEVSVDNIDTECMCRKSGKKNICDGAVSVEGDAQEEPGLRWLAAIAAPIHVSSVLLPIAHTMYFGCQLPAAIDQVLVPWNQKGLQARYQRGSKHFQARISVYTPQAVVMGQQLEE